MTVKFDPKKHVTICDSCDLGNCASDNCPGGNDPRTLHQSIAAWRLRCQHHLEASQEWEKKYTELKSALCSKAWIGDHERTVELAKRYKYSSLKIRPCGGQK